MHREDLDGERIFLLHDFLSPDECRRYIADSEGLGYDDAPISTSAGFVMRKDVRNNERVMTDDVALAATLFERARPHLVPAWFRWELAGLNERFRFYRYDPGQYFAPHADGYFERHWAERSQFTLMVYLNDDFKGGETCFERHSTPLVVRPKTGMALVFYHHQVHEGAPVIEGRKYVLRTDVMYRRKASQVE
jgi:predicted 2-oxoglutarate/Fe(II)-dependent dioxygenase YbiX